MVTVWVLLGVGEDEEGEEEGDILTGVVYWTSDFFLELPDEKKRKVL